MSLSRIDDVLDVFVGVHDQIPPMHSAVHVDGRRLYEYARAGEEVSRPARRVEILEISRIALAGDDLDIRVTCSKGTYIRTLAQDIGRALGCGAHLVGLRRTSVGPLHLAAAASFEQLEAAGRDGARARLLAPEVLVAGLARFDATDEEAEHFVHGRWIDRRGGEEREEIALYSPGGRFLGVGLCQSGGRVAPLRLLAGEHAKSPDFA